MISPIVGGRDMSRSIYGLLFCAVLVFGTVWKLAPGLLDRVMPFLINSQPTEPAPPAVVTEPQEKTDRKKASGAGSPQVAVAQSSEFLADESTVPEEGGGATNLRPGSSLPPRVFSISAEDTALYSANSPGGRVIRVLKKGEVVELQFTFFNPGQEWTYVNVKDKRVSGFLRSSSLRNPADGTTP